MIMCPSLDSPKGTKNWERLEYYFQKYIKFRSIHREVNIVCLYHREIIHGTICLIYS